MSCHAYRVSPGRAWILKPSLPWTVPGTVSRLALASSPSLRNPAPAKLSRGCGTATSQSCKQDQALSRLYSHRMVVFNARRNTGNELEEHNQILVHADSDLLLLISLQDFPLIPAGLLLCMVTE